MPLTRADRERLHDSRLKLQSVANSLRQINPDQIPDYEEIESCLEDAHRTLANVLRAPDANAPPAGKR